jgi:hypothetical protein
MNAPGPTGWSRSGGLQGVETADLKKLQIGNGVFSK